MALPTVIKTLKNFLGTKIVAPKTVTQAITHFGSKFNDRRLDQVIDEMKTDLDAKALNADLTDIISGGEVKTITSTDSAIVVTDIYSKYVVRGGVCYFQFYALGTDTAQHNLGIYMPKPLFGNYLYFNAEFGGQQNFRIAGDGSVRVQFRAANQTGVIVGSYPIRVE